MKKSGKPSLDPLKIYMNAESYRVAGQHSVHARPESMPREKKAVA
jgi:hypothetical protein